MGLLFKDPLRINFVLTDSFQSFEVMDIRARSLKCTIRFLLFIGHLIHLIQGFFKIFQDFFSKF